jgi:outer membrane protein assembly factor BamB
MRGRVLVTGLVAGCLALLGVSTLTPAAFAGGGPPPYDASPVAPILTPPPSWDATNYQENATHDGVAPGPVLPRTLHRLWSQTFTGGVSYPIVAGGMVYVSVSVDDSTSAYHIYAFNGRTGQQLWRSKLLYGNDFPYSSMAYANGRLFWVGMWSDVMAFDAATGALLWSKSTNQALVNSPIVAANGLVYVDTSWGYVDAFTQSGLPKAGAAPMKALAPRWTSGGSYVNDGQWEGPAVTSDGSVYVSGTCHTAQRFGPTGLVWGRDDGCNGGGGHTAVVHGGQLWARADYGNLPNGKVFATSDGRQVGSFTGNFVPPAFDGTTAITISQDQTTYARQLIAVDTRTFRVLWRGRVADSVSSPAVVSGHVAYVGTTTGRVLGLSTATGAQVWSGDAGEAVPPGDEFPAFGMGGMNIGDGLLAVPTQHRLVVFGG